MLEGREGARLQQHALMHFFLGQAGDVGVADHLHGFLRLVIHQIDGGQPGGDLRLGNAVQALVHLIGEQACRGAQQVHRHQPVRHAADHFIAVRPDRGQVDIVIEQRQGIHRLQLVGAALEIEFGEGGAHLVLCHARGVLADEILGCHPQGLEAFAVLAAPEIQRRQLAQGLHFQLIAAPAEAQLFQLLDSLGHGDGAGIECGNGVMEQRLRRQLFVAAAFDLGEPGGRLAILVLRRGQARLGQFSGQGLAWVQFLGQPGQRRVGKVQTSHAQRALRIGQVRRRLPDLRIAGQDRTGLFQMGMGVFPVFHSRFNQPAPESGMAVGVEARAAQFIIGVAVTPHHVLRRRPHGGELGIARQGRIMGLDKLHHAQRFGGKAVGQVKARQRQPRRTRLGRRLLRRRLGEAAFGGQEAAAAGDAPFGEIEIGGSVTETCQRRWRHGHRHLRWGQRHAAGTGDGDARLRHIHFQIIDIGRDHQAAGGGQGGEIGEDPQARHAASRRRRNDGEHVAAVRVQQLEGAVGGGQQGGERCAPGIGLVAGKADDDGGGRDLRRDFNFKVGALAARADLRRRLQGDAQNAKSVAGHRVQPLREIAQRVFQVAGIEVGRIFQHHPGGEAAHEHGGGAAARTLEGDQRAITGALAIGHRIFRHGRRCFGGLHLCRLHLGSLGMGISRCGLGVRRLGMRIGRCGLGIGRLGVGVCGLGVRISFCFSGLGYWFLGGKLRHGLGDAFGLRLADRDGHHLGGNGLGGAGRGIGGDVGLGRQDVENDLGAVLEMVIAGIGVGIEFDNHALSVDAPGGVFDPGGRQARDHRDIGARQSGEADGHFSRTGKDLIGNVLGPVEHQAGELLIAAGAQLDFGQARHIQRLGRGFRRRHQIRHGAGEIDRCHIHNGARADLADMQLDRLADGKAQGHAVGVGAAAGEQSRHGGGDRRRINVGLGAEGDGEHAAGGGGADLGGGGNGKTQSAITALHRAADAVGPCWCADAKRHHRCDAQDRADQRTVPLLTL